MIVGASRYVVGSAFMIGVAPEYLGVWLIWRGASIALPGWMYQWGDDKLYSLYQRLILFFFETCTRVEVVMYGDAEEALKKKESVLYIANHQSTVDWLIADMVSVRAGCLGNLRYIMKNTLQMLPLYGHYFYAHGCIYVKRGKFNQGKMINALNYLKHPDIRTWLVIFPEGTRYYPKTPKVIEKSEQYARDNNVQVLKHHLTPKSRGTWLAVEHLHEKLDAIYDVSVFYDGIVAKDGVRGCAPQLIEFLMGRCKKVHIHLRRIPMHEVPNNEEDLKSWMHNFYLEKDQLAENFFSTDSEVRATVQERLGGKVSKINIWNTMSSFLFFSTLTGLYFTSSQGRMAYLQLLLYGTLGSYGWLAIRSVC